MFLLPREVMLDVKSCLFQYKFLNNILVNNFWLNKRKIIQNDFCTFCNIECETLLHLFWDSLASGSRSDSGVYEKSFTLMVIFRIF